MIEYGVTMLAVFLASLSPLYFQSWKMQGQINKIDGKISVLHRDVKTINGGK